MPDLRAVGDVDLQRMISAKGPDFSLANRRPFCPLCPGRVRFIDCSSAWPRTLDTISSRDDAWWRFNEEEKRRVMALGWDLKDGHWHDPDGRPGWRRRSD